MLFLLNISGKAVCENLYGLDSFADPLVTNENKLITDPTLSIVERKYL